ncbi:MAG: DUF3488 and transglutaminase-like domain-containing protein [Thermodesulfobacteriaceae bacterium]|nr:DUF3488 and transglutaminase-like domain-containing protein [Thermodesulfobacteriaceae bacterium]MCX8041113.1 DUF3488 and transglutaminase-like domain-containing protein [Thermodesulfobacteriaceae bacterium]MDW8136574.1 DUF3488 and transglutaminase-like domain-containing protein [Thermodesulfobacterium sp.]
MKEIKLKNLLLFFTYLISLICILLTFKAIDKFYFSIIIFLFFISLFFEKHQKFCPRLFINIMGIVFILIFLFTTNLSNLLENSLKTLTFLLSLKLLEDKKVRDYLEIYLLCFLILAGCSYFYTNIFFFLLLIGILFLLNTSLFLCLYILEDQNFIIPSKKLLKIFYINFIPFFSLFLSSIFFIFLPRLSSPLFNLNIEEREAKTGFSDQVTIGIFSKIQESNSIVLRVEMEKIDFEYLYWRGITLDYFDGKSWTKSKENTLNFHTLPHFFNNTKIKQTIYLNLPQENYLLTLDKPIIISGNFQYDKDSDLSIKILETKTYPVRYYVYSVISDIGEEKINKKNFLQLPQLRREVEELAKNLKGKSEEETVKNILKFFKESGFKYSLKNLPISTYPLEDFLLKYKYGNCEYFASAMAVLLRINGIPARLVAGYKGGEYNEWGKYYLVREKNAHTWVEVYLNGRWKRYDPTPSGIILTQPSFFKEKIIFVLDLINYYYHKFILDYNLQLQVKILKTFKDYFTKEDIKTISIQTFNKTLLLKIFLVLFFIVIIYLSYLNFKHKTFQFFLPLERKILIKFLKTLKKFGYHKKEEEGLEEFLEKIKDPFLREKSKKIIEILEIYLYKDQTMDIETYQRLKEFLKEIENFNYPYVKS